MIAWLLIQKIASLFCILLVGVALTKLGILKSTDSRVLSALSVYVAMPCTIFTAFQVNLTAEVADGLMLAMGAAVMINILLLVLVPLLAKVLKLDAVEQMTLIYPNAANLTIPLVAAVLGSEWVIYTSAFITVQLVLLWSHGKAKLCGETRFDWKKILCNVNIAAIAVGILMLFTGLRFPAPVQEAIGSLGGMVGPIGMLVAGMLIAGMDLKKVFSSGRLWLVTALRLVIIPLVLIGLVRLSGAAALVPGGQSVLLVVLLAAIAPAASSIMQMAQVYGRDAEYASALNVSTTLLCILSMPAMVWLYQL